MPSRRKDRCSPSRAGPTFLPLARTRTSMPRKKRLIRAAWARLQRTPFFWSWGPVFAARASHSASTPFDRISYITKRTRNSTQHSRAVIGVQYYLLAHFQSCCSERAIDCPSIVIPFGIIYRIINRQSKTLNIKIKSFFLLRYWYYVAISITLQWPIISNSSYNILGHSGSLYYTV